MRFKTAFLWAVSPLAAFPLAANAGAITLDTAGNFSVLAGSTVTNTGLSVINGGDVGVSGGPSIVGFPPGTIVPPNTTHAGDAVAIAAQNDLINAFNTAANLAPTQTLTGQNLGGLTLDPGVYFFSSSAQLTGTLTLDDMGDPNAQFDFEIGSTLTTASGSSVVTINGGTNPGSTVFWDVGSSATLGTGTAFEGHILAAASITLTTGATILDGSALAINGAVTLDTNTIDNSITSAPSGNPTGPGGSGGSPTPAPLPTPAAMALTLLPLVWLTRRRLARI